MGRNRPTLPGRQAFYFRRNIQEKILSKLNRMRESLEKNCDINIITSTQMIFSGYLMENDVKIIIRWIWKAYMSQ